MDSSMMHERARAGFAEALEGHPFNSVDSLEREIEQGSAVLWSGPTSDVFVRIDGGICEMGPAAGDVNEIMSQALPQIEQFARDNQCSEMHVQAGREGWRKLLAPQGYELAAVILRKKL